MRKKKDINTFWYLDTGCSYNMCGDKSVFLDLDESFRNTMMFGNNSTISVMSKGNIKIHTKENSNQLISKVFFVPDLKTKLFRLVSSKRRGMRFLSKVEFVVFKMKKWD